MVNRILSRSCAHTGLQDPLASKGRGCKLPTREALTGAGLVLAPAAGAAVLLMLYAMLNRHAFIPSRVTEYGIESLESLFVMLARALQSCIGRSNLSDIVLHTHAQGTQMLL